MPPAGSKIGKGGEELIVFHNSIVVYLTILQVLSNRFIFAYFV